jgi:Ni,Fe-hydrogenase III small subunit/Pyruvate/2-oxoacid:ferredoxin oxidoreductase delta subunit
MPGILRTRLQQGYRTMRYPAGPAPVLPKRFAGRPVVDGAQCAPDCRACAEVCPTEAITAGPSTPGLCLDTGRCIFCRACEAACPHQAIRFSSDPRMAAARREDLRVGAGADPSAALRAGQPPAAFNAKVRKLFGRSLKLREVSAGGCNACEADTNVLNTLAWDLGRFGIQFVASPRHADGLLITGPVTRNMEQALRKTYDATPSPKIVIAVGACAVSAGLYRTHAEVHKGAAEIVPVDLFIPGCPPHPATILDGILRWLGTIKEDNT